MVAVGLPVCCGRWLAAVFAFCSCWTRCRVQLLPAPRATTVGTAHGTLLLLHTSLHCCPQKACAGASRLLRRPPPPVLRPAFLLCDVDSGIYRSTSWLRSPARSLLSPPISRPEEPSGSVSAAASAGCPNGCRARATSNSLTVLAANPPARCCSCSCSCSCSCCCAVAAGRARSFFLSPAVGSAPRLLLQLPAVLAGCRAACIRRRWPVRYGCWLAVPEQSSSWCCCCAVRGVH